MIFLQNQQEHLNLKRGASCAVDQGKDHTALGTLPCAPTQTSETTSPGCFHKLPLEQHWGPLYFNFAAHINTLP